MTVAANKAFVILDGTLLHIDRIAADRPYYVGKHKRHGMNVQVIADAFGRLLRASPALPGAVHDIKAARTHGIIEALTQAGIRTWADKGCQGAQGTIQVPYGAAGASTCTVNHLADLLRRHLKTIRSRLWILPPGRIAVIVLAVLRHGQRLADMAGETACPSPRLPLAGRADRAARRPGPAPGPADLGFRGLDNDILDPVIVTGYAASRTHKLTPGEKEANRVLAVGRAPVEHGFAHLKNWRILTKLRTDPARATQLLRALLVLTNLEVNR